MVGVTGLEPVTLRLSSACSNQLSYTPAVALRAMADRPAFTLRYRASEGFCWPASRSSLYERRLVELRRLELLTYSLQSYRSTN